MEKEIYLVEHYCGWGPYTSSFHASVQGATLAFEEKAEELRAKRNYIKGSWKKNKKPILEPEKIVRHDEFQTQGESNNENGHEFWENDEYLDIRKEVLQS